MSDVFISYSRKDQVFARRLFESLTQEQFDSWADWDDIPYSSEWWQQIQRGIEAANNFVCILSPSYIESKICNDELAYARQLGKRIIPVVRREFMQGGQYLPEIRAELFGKPGLNVLDENVREIGKINYIFFRKKKGYDCQFDEVTRRIVNPDCDGFESDADDFAASFSNLLNTLREDPQHTQQHTTLLIRAQEWEQANRRADRLLRGKDIAEARQWLVEWTQDEQRRSAENPPRAPKQPAPADLHRLYIHASVARRTTSRLLSIAAAIIMLGVISAVVVLQRGASQNSIQIQQTAAASTLTAAVSARDDETQVTLTAFAQSSAATNAAVALVVGEGLAEEIFVVNTAQLPVYGDEDTTSPVITTLIIETAIDLAEPVEAARQKFGREGDWIAVAVPAMGGMAFGHVQAQFISAQTRLTDRGFDAYVGTLRRVNPPSGYFALWADQEALGLPDPFDYLPVRISDQTALANVRINGFGPNTFALRNWRQWYSRIGGLHNGLDVIVPTGTPVVSLCNGLIISDWVFMANPEEKSLIVWCFLPNDSDMSSVLVAYTHLQNNTLFEHLDYVEAGQVIGTTGSPAGTIGNDHLHLEVHLLTGDVTLPNQRTPRRLLKELDREQPMDNNTPWNPALFFTPRIINLIENQLDTTGFGGTLPAYPTSEMLTTAGAAHLSDLGVFSVAYYRYRCTVYWEADYAESGCYASAADLRAKLATFPPWLPYPYDSVEANAES